MSPRVVFPPQCNPRLRDAWNRLQRPTGAGGLPATLANTCFVSKDGFDGTAVRGSLVNKFLTIQGALNAAQTGDAIFIAPGVYEENVVLRDDIAAYSITAEVIGTVLISPTAGNAMSLLATAQMQFLVLSGLVLSSNEAGTPALVIGQANAPAGVDPFGQGALIVQDCLLTNQQSPECARLFGFSGGIFQNVLFLSNGSLTNVVDMHEVARMYWDTFNVDGDFGIAYDPLAPLLPDDGVQDSIFYNGNVRGRVFCSELGRATFKDSRITDGVLTNLNDYQDDVGKFTAHDTEIGGLDATGTLNVFGYDTVLVDVDGCRIQGPLVSDGSAGSTRHRIRARNCSFDQGNPISAGEKVELDLLGSAFDQADLAAVGILPDRGRIMRERIRIAPVPGGIAASPGAAITIDPPLPDGTSAYTVLVENYANVGGNWSVETGTKLPTSVVVGAYVADIPAQLIDCELLIVTQGKFGS